LGCNQYNVASIVGTVPNLSLTITKADVATNAPTNSQVIGLIREYIDAKGLITYALPQSGDGNGGSTQGISITLAACINAHYSEKNRLALNTTLTNISTDAIDVTKYVGSSIPAFTPTVSEPKLAQGLSSPYPFYAYNGTAWVAVGSGGAITTGDSTNISLQKTGAGIYKAVVIDETLDSSKIKNGSIAASDLSQHAIDTIKNSLVNPTNGYLPYKISGNTFGNSPIYTDGTDIGLSGNIDSVKKITTISVIAPSAYLTATDAGVVGNLSGTYFYCYKYYTADGETEPTSPEGSLAITVANKKVNLSGITVSSNPKVIGRKLYRTRASADDAAEMQFLATIADNTTTTYLDNIADGALGATTDFTNTTGGEIYNNNLRVYSEGTSSLSIGKGNGMLGYSNTAIGPSSMTGGGYGYRNTAVGLYSQYLLRNGARNVSIGTHSLNDNLDGDDNTGLGYGALHFNLASHNTAVGREAASANVNGEDNTAVGYFAGERNINGNLNTSVGKYALLENLGNNNTAVGAISLQNVTAGTSNVGLGYQSGTYTNAGGNVTTAIGSLFIGFDTRALANSSTYETVIGSGARGHGDFTTTIGAASILKTIIYGNIGLGTSNPLYKLDIDANTGSSGNPIRLLGLQVGSTSDSLVSSANGVLKRYGLVSNLSAGENNSQVLNATIAAGANLSGGGALFTVTVSGAQVGDFVDFSLVSDDNDLTDINIKAWVSATNTVSYQVENKRATSIVFTNKPIKCRVRR